jgi:hypothetical protein
MSRRMPRRLAVVGLGVAAFLAGVDTALYILRKKPPVQREAATAVDPAAIAQRAVDLANSERTAAGLDVLATPDNLKECSRIRVGYMASHHTIEHSDESGSLGRRLLWMLGVCLTCTGERTLGGLACWPTLPLMGCIRPGWGVPSTSQHPGLALHPYRAFCAAWGRW